MTTEKLSSEKAAKYLIKELLKKGATEIVTNSYTNTQTQIKFVNNGITAVTNWENSHLGVFVNFKKKLVSTSIESFDVKTINENIKKIVQTAKFVEENKNYNGIAKGPFKYKNIPETYDKKIENLGEKGIDIVEDALNIAKKEGANRCSGNLEFGTSKQLLITSENVIAEDKGTSIYFSLRAFTDKDASGHKTSCSRMLNKLEYKYASKKAAEFSVAAKSPQKIDAGKYDIIFDPMSFSVILDNMASAASIFSVEAGLSFFHDSIGKKVADDKITLIDDASLPNGFASGSFDDEGFPAMRKEIIGNGIFKTYLHNYSTAKKYGVSSTGNAGLISPDPTNTILLPGKISNESLFKSVDKGLYITNIWYTRYQNHATGDFSTIPRDAIFYIDNGELKKAVKDIRISDNMRNILNSIDQISNKPQQVMGWETEKPVITPLVRVNNINITRSI